VVVTGTDKRTLVVAAAHVGRRYGIPSLYVQPALHIDDPRNGPFLVDYGAVVDEWSRVIHQKHSPFPPDHITVTGLPRWDNLVHMVAEIEQNRDAVVAEVRSQFGLQAGERLVVFASQPLGKPYLQRVITTMTRAVSRHPATRLVIKLHPQEFIVQENYQAMLPEDGTDGAACRPHIVTRINLYALLAAADLVLILSSNVGFEAALLDRPVLVVNLTGEPDPMPFVQNGIATGAYSEAEVEQQIERLLNDPLAIAELQERRQTYFQANPQMADGKATERVVDLLQRLGTRP
jgi:UDP-N-acetylglucosamine 2-epimerase